jgi:hypothetical protein
MAFLGNFTCDSFRQGLLSGEFDFSSTSTDVYKIALYTNAATLNASTDTYTNSGEVVAVGYTEGGEVVVPIIGTVEGVNYLNFADVTWETALSARGALIYKFDDLDNPAVCVLDFGAEKTSTTFFAVQFPPSTSSSALIRLI